MVPKQPKKDYNKIISLDGHRIRMTASIVSDNPDDKQRKANLRLDTKEGLYQMTEDLINRVINIDV